MSVSSKTSYHPYILLAFYLNCLPDEWQQPIPRSTRNDWKHRDITVLYGHEWYLQNKHLFDTLKQVASNKKILKINTALIRAIALKRFLQQYHSTLRQKRTDVQRVVFENIQKIAVIAGLRTTLKYLQRSYSWYTSLRKQPCKHSPLALCYIKHPAQLLKKEIKAVKEYCSDQRFIHWPLSAVYHQIIRDKTASFTLSTFYKYVSCLQLKRIKSFSRRKHHTIGIRAQKPLQIIHADTTLFTTLDNARHYIYLVQDNFSRTILRFRVAKERKAAILFDTLAEVHKQFLAPANIETCELITDGGVENYGSVTDWVNNTTHPSIQHLIAQQDITFSNSMIEAANKQLKYRFLYHKQIPDFNALAEYVRLAVEDYNNRPHNTLSGLTPLEALKGLTIDTITRQQHLVTAKTNRLAENTKTKCCYHSF